MNSRLFGIRLLSIAFGYCVVGTTAVFGNDQKQDPLDWTHWRGPQMNGISLEEGIVDSWSPRGENLLWKRDDLGSRSTPVVMNGKLYLMCRDNPGTVKEGEKVVCVDAMSGKTLWENRFNVFLSDVPKERVGWSSVAADPIPDPDTGVYRVFAQGGCGFFQCLDAKTGQTLWSHSMSEEFGALNTYGGRTNFPLIHKNLVIVSAIVIGWGDMAKPAHRFIAFDKRNGQPVWFMGTRLFPYDTTYSSPVLTIINGQAMMVFGSGDGGIHAFQPQTGKKIWTYNVSRRGINTTPLVVGKTIVCGHSEENLKGNLMGALFAIDGTKRGDVTKTGELWKTQQWFVGKSSPVHANGRIYTAEDKGTMLIVDLKSGKKIATHRLRGPMRSSPLYVDGKIYVCTSNGIWWTLRPSKDGVEVIHHARLGAGESYGSPIVSHGRMYVPLTDALYCVGRKDHKPTADPLPEPLQETPVERDAQPGLVQVVPVESLLKPGQLQKFHVRLYNANGQFLCLADAAKVEFSIDGPGSVKKVDIGTSKVWQYAAPGPGEQVHAAVNVTAKAGDLSGTARIRVVPDLPWSFDFSDGQVPITWVGCRYRHIVIDFELFKKLEKQSPLSSQLYIYLRSGFVNRGAPALKYDDSTSRLEWTEFLRFLGLLERMTTLKQTKNEIDLALALLEKEKVINKWIWAEPEGIGIQLTVPRGDRKVDGNGVMMKLTTIPKGKRSQGWMGAPAFGNYTFQADVFGIVKNNKMPDIGLTAQRYVLDLMGASQQVQIRTWHTELDRFSKTSPFRWKPNVWYTMKFRTSVENGTAVLRGKVWPRGKKEPEIWSVEATDPGQPNAVGNPGFMGNAFDAELFYDNLQLTNN